MKKESQRDVIPIEHIEQSIHIIRGQKVMLDVNLANLYGVETKAMNRGVKRNIGRFPVDFMFQLSEKEWEFLRCQFGTSKTNSLRSQFVTSKETRGGRQYLPYAFTEQGVAMLSSVLRSPQAIAVNIEIMRTFVRMRHLFVKQEKLSKEVGDIKSFLLKNSQHHTAEFKKIWQTIDRLAARPEVEER